MSEAAFRWVSALVVAAALAFFVGLRFGASAGALLFVVAVAAASAWVAIGSARRSRLAEAPFPEAHRAILLRDVEAYRRLDAAGRARFEREVAIFLGEQTITGPRGEPLDDELRLLVAASAVIVAFGRPGHRYPTTRDVVVYEGASFDASYQAGTKDARYLGMVHGSGPIVLSADALRAGFRNPHDAQNVGVHELAHVLDFESGQADGVPSFMPWKAVRPWVALMHEEMKRIEAHQSILRDYAATNEAEFFAVATEMFFEQPERMKAKHPALYALMQQAYGQDPAAGRS